MTNFACVEGTRKEKGEGESRVRDAQGEGEEKISFLSPLPRSPRASRAPDLPFSSTFHATYGYFVFFSIVNLGLFFTTVFLSANVSVFVIFRDHILSLKFIHVSSEFISFQDLGRA